MRPSQQTAPSVYTCETCGNVLFGDHPAHCCGAPMTEAGADTPPVDGPDLDRLLKDVFDMSGTELEVCLCVMEADERTVAEVADALDVDRSLVSRHLNHLADLGVVEKSRRIRPEGGHVHVYFPVEEDAVRRRLKTELYRWLRDAVAAVQEVSREKVETIASVTDRSNERRIYE
ncbi:MAG: helix-turn-helix domain-containing protein [Halobacteriales archaeon]